MVSKGSITVRSFRFTASPLGYPVKIYSNFAFQWTPEIVTNDMEFIESCRKAFMFSPISEITISAD